MIRVRYLGNRSLLHNKFHGSDKNSKLEPVLLIFLCGQLLRHLDLMILYLNLKLICAELITLKNTRFPSKGDLKHL